MSKEEEVLWLCSRCAKRTGKKRELEPTVLRVCSHCHVENWVRPVGHAGADVASPEVVEPTGEVAETIPITEPKVMAEEPEPHHEIAAVTAEPEPERVEQTPKEREIARLKAELEALEG